MPRVRRWADGSVAVLDRNDQGLAVVIRDAGGSHLAASVPADSTEQPTAALLRGRLTDGRYREVSVTLLAATLVDAAPSDTVEDLGDGWIRRTITRGGGSGQPGGQTTISVERTVGGTTEFTENITFYGGTHLEQRGTRGADGQGSASGTLFGPIGQRLGDSDWRRFSDANGIHESQKYSYTDGSQENHRVDEFPNGTTAKQDSAQDASGRFTKNDTDLTWQDHEIQSHFDRGSGDSTITTHASDQLPDGRIHVIDGSMVKDGSGKQVGDVSVTEEIRDFNHQTKTTTTTLTHPDQSRDVTTTRVDPHGSQQSTQHLPPTASLDWSEIGQDLLDAMTTGDPVRIPGITDAGEDELGQPSTDEQPPTGTQSRTTTSTTSSGRTTTTTTVTESPTQITTATTETSGGRSTRTTTQVNGAGTNTTTTVDGVGTRSTRTASGTRSASGGATEHPRIGQGRGSGITAQGTACDPGADGLCTPIFLAARQAFQGSLSTSLTPVADLVDAAGPTGGLGLQAPQDLAAATGRLVLDLFGDGTAPILDADTGPAPGGYSAALRAGLGAVAPDHLPTLTGWQVSADELFVELLLEDSVTTTFSVTAPPGAQVEVQAEFDLADPPEGKFGLFATVEDPTRTIGDHAETFNVVLSQLDGAVRPVRARLLDAGSGQEQAVSDWVLLLDPRTAVQPRDA